MRTGASALLAALLILPAPVRAQTAEKPQPAATAPAAPRQAPRPAARQPAARPSVTVFVTDREGKPLEGIAVSATGPVDRDATTAADGTVVLRNLSAGAYRLHFEGDGVVTFEKEVTVAARAVKTTAALSAAPPPPAPPAPPPAVEPAAPAVPTGPAGEPTSVSIPDFFERNRIGNVPSKRSPVGCTGNFSATLLQLREPLEAHSHDDADEMLYVVAGDGTEVTGGKTVTLTPGMLTVLPKGTAHSLTRRGSRPLILLSFLTGPPCPVQ